MNGERAQMDDDKTLIPVVIGGILLALLYIADTYSPLMAGGIVLAAVVAGGAHRFYRARGEG